MEVYKLAFSGQTADANAVASLDIREDGHIVAIAAEIDVTGMDVLNDGAQAEVSFASTSGYYTNDTHASMLTVGTRLGAITTGGVQAHAQREISGLAIAVAAGERIYAHLDVTGTVNASGQFYMYVMPAVGGSTRVPTRRA